MEIEIKRYYKRLSVYVDGRDARCLDNDKRQQVAALLAEVITDLLDNTSKNYKK